ncbi:CPBP family intramembrane glutamic endopeptidase [Pseudonocardia endophytica]|uniref:CAAX prenyl protease-like protein n=1 Tax=Pseudonocardia endophytica TaxID=401976 RepID=A0A4R1I0C2_PSEEN|nr:CPBP family intramembrane glutamic endopeptidase [Pseudonocardia endophytica]TCK26955.1 CAAX prenyl protease-like protein [Pseudonocardia endophytica]
MTTLRAPETTGRARRLVEGTAFVGVWIALGYLLPVDANVYLLLGIPLTLVFQLVVRRRPLRELWLRDASRFRLDRVGVALAVALAVTPAVVLVQVARAGEWSSTVWMVAAIVGAVPAAWALRGTRFLVTLREAVPTILVGAVVLGLVAVVPLLLIGRPFDPVAMAGHALLWAALYLPVVFVLEEVAFRGALDAHVQHPGERRGIASAVYLSLLWGAWHLPITPAGPIPGYLEIQALVVSLVLGIPLTYAWRRTGSLAPAGVAHAVYDGIRNGLTQT